MKPIFIAYYTKNTGYEQEVRNLKQSLELFEVEHEIQGIHNLGNWNKNTHYKPKFIKEMLLKHNRPVVYVDADAVICSPPTWFDDLTCDIAAPIVDWADYGRKRGIEGLSGTLYFGINSIDFLDQWIELCDTRSSTWDQKLLHQLLRGKEFVRIPDNYCMIFDTMRKCKDPVIRHMQASRRFKREVQL